MKQIDVLESQQLDRPHFDLAKHMAVLNGAFFSKITPEQGVYGVREVIKDNGVVERLGKNELGHRYKEYYRDGKIFRRREILGKGYNATTEFDDFGNDYARVVKKLDNNKAEHISTKLKANTVIKKGNFESATDSQGRLIRAKMTDLSLREGNRAGLPGVDKSAYRVNDQRGHLIADIFKGPNGPENLVPQLDKVNLSDMRKVENIIQKLKEDPGNKVDYEIKVNYKTPHSHRPASFEVKITVNGKVYTELPEELKKIYNEASPSTVQKAVTTIGEKLNEKFGAAHDVGLKSGLTAAGLTMAVSSCENVSAFLDGNIDAEEMTVEIAKDTAAAGALGYGTAFVTQVVSQAMCHSSRELIQKVGGSCAPAMAVAFAVDSYDSVEGFFKGEIDGQELAYDLGDSAATLAGSFAGGAVAGAAIGTAAGPVGTVAAGVVGGVVGCVLASEVYATAVDLGAQGVEIVAEKAKGLAKETTDFFEDQLPDKVADVKSAFNDYFAEHKLGIQI